MKYRISVFLMLEKIDLTLKSTEMLHCLHMVEEQAF